MMSTFPGMHKGASIARNDSTHDLDIDSRWHVYPDFPGEREHEMSELCWCEPYRDSIEPRVIIHNRMAEA